ncbi:MAG: hypothetical protein KAH23_01550 [Kiritimatiellae bacterium]|nr:hypothetical protein [Kiritimatiellia bacterium]
MTSIVDRILEPIEQIVGCHSDWFVGTTEDPGCCRGKRDEPVRWKQWDAGSYIAARAIEEYLLARGTVKSTGCSCSGKYIYIH